MKDTFPRTAGPAGGLRDVPGSRFNKVCPAEGLTSPPSPARPAATPAPMPIAVAAATTRMLPAVAA
ncbi:MAG TPA: hypothetical protein VKF14_04115 [Candidatus Dormibacteraeota bacterium]|nr:hypothetical protein [Candidatus Dormibacteraeota bacterium]